MSLLILLFARREKTFFAETAIASALALVATDVPNLAWTLAIRAATVAVVALAAAVAQFAKIYTTVIVTVTDAEV